MSAKLFSFTTGAHHDEALVSMPGFSHRGQPFKVQVTWYPFEEYRVRAYCYANNRRQAVRQLERAGLRDVRDLDGGQRKPEAPKCVQEALR